MGVLIGVALTLLFLDVRVFRFVLLGFSIRFSVSLLEEEEASTGGATISSSRLALLATAASVSNGLSPSWGIDPSCVGTSRN